MCESYEPISADGAVVRPLAGVRAQVDFQSPDVSDFQPAVATLVSLLAAVDFDVHPQVPLGVEVLPAHTAAEGPLVGVCPQVEIQTRLEAKLLPTLRARKLLLAGVGG